MSYSVCYNCLEMVTAYEKYCNKCISRHRFVQDADYWKKEHPKESCNRHSDCEEAERLLLQRHPGKTRFDISPNFHCHDDCCEDCFGQ